MKRKLLIGLTSLSVMGLFLAEAPQRAEARHRWFSSDDDCCYRERSHRFSFFRRHRDRDDCSVQTCYNACSPCAGTVTYYNGCAPVGCPTGACQMPGSYGDAAPAPPVDAAPPPPSANGSDDRSAQRDTAPDGSEPPPPPQDDASPGDVPPSPQSSTTQPADPETGTTHETPPAPQDVDAPPPAPAAPNP